MNKRFSLIFVFLSALLPCSGQGFGKIVIDPGHGGKDPGCRGASAWEKDVTLAIALKLGDMLSSEMPDVKVTFTRKKDEFIELDKRAEIANASRADLFLCIHCNSGDKSVYGAESYVMGIHKTAENVEVARRENSSILMEENYQARYEGFDPHSPESDIIFSLYQNAYLEQSLEFAARVQQRIEGMAERHNRGVKQAGFLVLFKTAMPSVLIETGFLSHPEEEKFLSSEKGQQSIARAIMEALKEYKADLEGTARNIAANGLNKDNILFRVQILTSSRPVPLDDPQFSGLKDLREYLAGGWYKYTAEETPDPVEAYRLQEEMRNRGFKSAFLVAFRKEERISLREAIKLTEK